MGLLPEDQAAAHLDKLLSAAYEAGLPVPCSIPPHNVKRFILERGVSVQDVKDCDSQTIDKSISLWIAKRKDGESWGPWYITNVILAKREADYLAAMEKDKQAARQSQIKPEMVMTDADLDYTEASRRINQATAIDKRKMIETVQKRTGRCDLTAFKAYMIQARYEREQS